MGTIYDVAEKAGVSVGTVSRYINKRGYVGAAAAERIAAAIEELGFRPSPIARSLTSRKSRMIGFVISDFANPFTAEVARGVYDLANEAGYFPLMYNTDGDAAREIEALSILRDHQVDGVIVTPPGSPQSDQFILSLIEQGVAVVLLGRQLDPPLADRVTTDTYSGALEAVRYLAKLGHQRIAALVGSSASGLTIGRRQGYLDGLEQSGLIFDERLLVEVTLDREGGEVGMTQLLRLRDRPTAVFAANDLAALGAMHIAIRRGISIPAEMSIIGFDDTVLSRYAQPELTTIAQPKFQLGRTAVELLLSRISANAPLLPREVVLPCELIRRESAAVPLSVSTQLQRSQAQPLEGDDETH